MFNKNDFVKSKLNPYVVGLVLEQSDIYYYRTANNTMTISGYIIKLADNRTQWIAEEDLEMILPAETQEISSELESTDNSKDNQFIRKDNM